MKIRAALVTLVLAAATTAAFWPAVRHDFLLEYDDKLYVAANPMVRAGLTGEGVRWAFTSVGYASNWHPLTWLSLMLDASVFGPSPRGYHLTNILLHAAAAVLLLTLWRRMTGALWPAAFIAFAFALHPLRVESVAWIAERKDVLAGVFFMLTLLAHLAYARRPGPGRLAAVAGCCALGLLAKPMAVTLPFVLLLLDYWPLGRHLAPGGRRPWLRLVGEKLPLFLLAAGAAAVTLKAQTAEGYMISLGDLPLPDRLANALVSYAAYLGKTLWPRDLYFFYPHPAGALSVARTAAAAALLAAVTVIALRMAGRRPYLPVGWFWFLGTLVPVIGVVQVGWQGLADRYTYLPGIGIGIMAAGALSRLAQRQGGAPRARPGTLARLLLAAGALLLALTLGLLTRAQVAHWRDGVTLFTRTLSLSPDNWVIRNDLGTALLLQGKPLEALPHLEAALALRPEMSDNQLNLGVALERLGRRAEAERHYREVLRRSPDMAKAWFNLASLLVSANRLEEAEAAYRGGLRLQPGHVAATYNHGLVLERLGKTAEALRAFQQVLRLDPGNAQASRVARMLQSRQEATPERP